uniref:Uncharacterized protein n=1 Tax=Romanomermis culicivorax TaxID=13658 RepID=A0A915J7Y0_ROMCU
RPNDFVQNTYAVYSNHQFPTPWEQHIQYNAVPAPYVTTPTDSSRASSQSSELQLALPGLRPWNAASTPAHETGANNQSTSAANMVILSKEITSADCQPQHSLLECDGTRISGPMPYSLVHLSNR